MARETIVSKRKVVGHARRAQARLEKAMRGSSREDVMIQALIGVAGVSLALRLLRVPAISRLATAVAPLLIFAALFTRAEGGSRRRTG